MLARPEKKKIIPRWRGYHGSGLLTGSLTGLELFHKKFDLPIAPVIHTEALYYFHRSDQSQSEEQFVAHCVAQLEALIKTEGAETIKSWHRRDCTSTRRVLGCHSGRAEKYDILLVVDEVVTGFGRLGSMFGSDQYGLKADMITIAKGLTSAYAPLSGSIIGERMWKVLEQGTDENGPIGHGWTYSAHPIGAAAGVANLKLLDDLNLIANAAEVVAISTPQSSTLCQIIPMWAKYAAKACYALSSL